jgi:iron complex transport system permease protein
VLVVALIGAIVLSLALGAVAIDPVAIVGILADRLGVAGLAPFEPQQASVLTGIRLPRVVLGALVGAGLGLAGAGMQGLYRSPMADPALVGIGSGAALGAAIGIVVALVAGPGAVTGVTAVGGDLGLVGALAPVLLAAVGAIVASGLIYRVASASGRTVVAAMLLGGIALNALFGALTGLVVLAVRNPQLRDVSFWTLGGLSGATWRAVILLVLTLIPVAILLWRRGPGLDALALGHASASHLGVDVRRQASVVLILVAVITGVAVSQAGVIAFVALVTPIAARRFLGASTRSVIIGSALLGASVIVLADLVARSIVSPAEAPVGLITAVVGAPIFLWLLVRDRGALAR